MKLPGFLAAISKPTAHWVVAALILIGMLAQWTTQRWLSPDMPPRAILFLATILAAVPLCIEMLQEILRGDFGVDILAFLSIGSALVLHQVWVAAIVVLMLSGGKALEEYATRRASSVLGALARRMPHIAHRIDSQGSVSDVAADSVSVGDRLAVYPHELCPVDGVVVQGLGTMDESYLTGEPFLIAKAPGTTVLSGAVNGDSALTIKAVRPATDSRYARIVEVLRASEQNRPRIRRMGERLGSWYTPLAVSLALLSWLLSGHPERFLAVLVIATPCPLLLAIPVAIIGAISVAAKHGIVVRDPSILEKVDRCRTVFVDKTGTLTYGRPGLTEIIATERWPRRALLQFAASLERYSKHPLASAILRAASDEHVPLLPAQDVSEAPGEGLTGHLDGHQVVLTGRSSLPAAMSARLSAVAPGLECVILIDGLLAGLLRFHDEPRAESRSFLTHLRHRHGIETIVLLSGDRPSEVARFAEKMEISLVHGGKSPEEKLDIVRETTAKSPTLYLGDGINDAPAMLNATAGVALGVNSDITSEAAGAVILQSSLASVDVLIHIGRRMRRIALASAVGGMALSIIGMAAGALGFLAPIEGALLQEVIDLAAILNSLRVILPVASLSDFTASPEANPTAAAAESMPVAS